MLPADYIPQSPICTSNFNVYCPFHELASSLNSALLHLKMAIAESVEPFKLATSSVVTRSDRNHLGQDISLRCINNLQLRVIGTGITSSTWHKHSTYRFTDRHSSQHHSGLSNQHHNVICTHVYTLIQLLRQSITQVMNSIGLQSK